jgi:hypothetical protein
VVSARRELKQDPVNRPSPAVSATTLRQGADSHVAVFSVAPPRPGVDRKASQAVQAPCAAAVQRVSKSGGGRPKPFPTSSVTELRTPERTPTYMPMGSCTHGLAVGALLGGVRLGVQRCVADVAAGAVGDGGYGVGVRAQPRAAELVRLPGVLLLTTTLAEDDRRHSLQP